MHLQPCFCMSPHDSRRACTGCLLQQGAASITRTPSSKSPLVWAPLPLAAWPHTSQSPHRRRHSAPAGASPNTAPAVCETHTCVNALDPAPFLPRWHATEGVAPNRLTLQLLSNMKRSMYTHLGLHGGILGGEGMGGSCEALRMRLAVRGEEGVEQGVHVVCSQCHLVVHSLQSRIQLDPSPQGLYRVGRWGVSGGE